MSSRKGGSPPPQELDGSSVQGSVLSAVVGASTVAGSEAMSARRALRVVNGGEDATSRASVVGSIPLSEKSIPTECPGCKPGSHKKHFDDCPSRVRKRKSDEMEVGGEPEPLMAVPFVDIGVNEISDHFASMTKYAL